MTLKAEEQVLLRNGCWQDGKCHREVRVHAIGGSDDKLVDDLYAEGLPVRRNSLLLAHCVSGFGSEEKPEILGDLSMGDREALLLHARRLTFGGQIDCVLACPACEERMDFQLCIDKLLLPVCTDALPRYFEELLVSEGRRFRVRFRIPSGNDVDEALSMSNGTVGQAVKEILSRCVEWVRTDEQPGVARDLSMEDWPEGLAGQISARMSELDPQAETELQLVCPACHHSFATCFDVGDYFARELAARSRCLYHEVHELALAYHWSEADILKLSPRRRRLYLDLLAESLSE
jgi:hypothetical protein